MPPDPTQPDSTPPGATPPGASTDPSSFEPYQPPHGPGRPETPTTEAFACPNCGSTQFNPGFIDDTTGNAAVRWFQGPVEYGLLGGIKRSGRTRRVIMSYRCTGCSRLELYAGDQV